MKNVKKVFSLILALVLVVALASTAFAALDCPYFTKVDSQVLSDSQWTKRVVVGNEQDVNFFAVIATDTYEQSQLVTEWNYFEYTASQGETESQILDALNTLVRSKVCATVTMGSDKLVYGSQVAVSAQIISVSPGPTPTYRAAAMLSVKVSALASAGLVRINVTGQNGAPTNTDCNFMIVLENGNASTCATGVTVEVYDLIDDYSAYIDDQTIHAANQSSSYLFYNDPSSAQTYATAANVMDNLLSEGAIAAAIPMSSEGFGYIDSVTMYDDFDNEVELSPYFTQDSYVGWMYGVYREISGNMTYVAASAELSACIFELQSGDQVVWAYGEFEDTMDFLANYYNYN